MPSYVHLFPTNISIYNTGYIVIGGDACQQVIQVNEGVIDHPNTMISPTLVNCPRCINTQLYKDAISAYHSSLIPPYKINEIPYMRNSLKHSKGRYDTVHNNEVRSWLGMDEYKPTEEEFDKNWEEYSSRTTKLKAERERSHAIYLRMKNYLDDNNLEGEIISETQYDLLSGESREVHYISLNDTDEVLEFNKMLSVDETDSQIECYLENSISQDNNLTTGIVGQRQTYWGQLISFLISRFKGRC